MNKNLTILVVSMFLLVSISVLPTTGIKVGEKVPQPGLIILNKLYGPDTYVSHQYPEENYANSKVIRISNEYGVGGSPGWANVAYAGPFDLMPLVGPYTNIAFAEMYFYYDGYENTDPEGRDLNIYRVTDYWDDDTLTWNNQPAYDPEPLTSAKVLSSTGDWIKWDVTDDVQDYVNEWPPSDYHYGYRISDDSYWGESDIPTTICRSVESDEEKFHPVLCVGVRVSGKQQTSQQSTAVDIVKQTSMLNSNDNTLYNGASGVSLITIEAVGEKGLDNWFSSDVGFTFSYQSDDIAEIKYIIDDGPVQDYIEPFYLIEEGEDRSLEWFAVDHWGTQSDVDGPFILSIDQTDPLIDLVYEVGEGNPEDGWEVLFTAIAVDYFSGMDRVEFYLNGVLQSTVYGAGPEYQWSFTYRPDDWEYIEMWAIAYDIAGNSFLEPAYWFPPGNNAFLESSMPYTDSIVESKVQTSSDNVLSSETFERDSHKVTEKLPSDNPLIGVFDPTNIIVIFDREMGENDWIVSDVSFPIFYESDRIAEVYYQIDNEGWMLYVEPLIISDDGIHSFMWYVVDSEGHTSIPDSISFKIDQTCPEIHLIKKRLGLNKVKIIANVHDETSGINRVHFVGNRGTGEYTDYDYPYEWVWPANDWLDIFFGFVRVWVYDNAGHKNYALIHLKGSSGFNQQSTIAQSVEMIQVSKI